MNKNERNTGAGRAGGNAVEMLAALMARLLRNDDLQGRISERNAEIDRTVQLYRRNAHVQRTSKDLLSAFTVLYEYYRECLYGPPNPCPTPIPSLDEETKALFTMGGKVPYSERYRNETYPSNYPLIYLPEEIECYKKWIQEGVWFCYGRMDEFLHEAVRDYPIEGKEVLNTGATTPWYESFCLHYGAKPVTVDYNSIVSGSAEVETIPMSDLEGRTFDCAFSLSSLEHDGLGGYGDPIDPDGDLKAMRRLRQSIKPGGLVYFNVPVGPDRVIFNALRVYGKIRLPMLLEGWQVLKKYGFNEEGYQNGSANCNPILVLQR